MEATTAASSAVTPETSETMVCRHHWIIAAHSSRNRFPAVCTLCAATREFPAEVEDARLETLDWSELWARWD